MKSKKLISHLLSAKTEQNNVIQEIIYFYEDPETFSCHLRDKMRPATIKAYTELLLAKLRNDSRPELLLTVDEIIEMLSRLEVKKQEMDEFHRILDVLALTLYIKTAEEGTDDDENSLESLNLFTKNDQRSFYVSHLLFKSLLDRGVIRDKDQKVVQDIKERLILVLKEESRGMSPIYCIAVESVKLLFDEKILNPLKFLSRILKPLRKTDVESFAVILCDFIEYVPNKMLGLCQAMNMLNELDLFLLLEKSARKVKDPEIDTKRCFFLLKNCVELFRELNLTYKSDLMSWDPEKSYEYQEAWDKFFTIVETLKENMKHLIVPAFGMLEQLDVLGPRWKLCLLERGFQNENSSVQTFCASYLLKSKELWTSIGNGSDSAFTGVINNTNLFSKNEITFDPELYCDFVRQYPDFVQLDQLQKSVPIYFTVKGLFSRLYDLNENHENEALTCLNQILSALTMVHNTLIRAEIIDLVVTFIFKRRWFKILMKLNLNHLLEPNEGTLLEGLDQFYPVSFDELTEIYRNSSIPMVLKRKFITNDLQFTKNEEIPQILYVHAYLHLENDPKLKDFCENLLCDFLTSLENNKISSDTSAIEELILHDRQLPINFVEKIVKISVLQLTNPLTAVQTKALLAEILKNVSENPILCENPSIRTSLEFLTDSMQLMCKTDAGKVKGKGDGEIFSKYYQALSVVRRNVFAKYGPDRVLMTDELEFTLYLMDVGGSRILTTEMGTLKTLFKKHLTANLDPESDSFEQSLAIVERCYTEMMSYRRFEYFWECLECFVSMILSPNLFPSWISDVIVPYYSKLMKLADVTQGVAHIILSKLFKLDIDIFRKLENYQEILIWGLLFGEQYNRNKRTETEICMEIHQKKPYLVTRYQYRESADVRALSVAMLMKICEPEYRNLPEIEKIFQEMFKKYSKVVGNRCYADSQTHLDKLRIIQALLVLPCVEDQFREMIQLSTFFDSNLPNVSYLLEILFARNVSDKYLEEHILSDDFMKELRPSGAESLFVILYYRCCTERANRAAFVDRVIKKILPFAMGQHFTTRLYAQTVLRKLVDRRLYLEGSELRMKLVKEGLDKSFELMGDTKNLRSFNDIRFKIIENLGNFGLEMIFDTIPRMTELAEHEIITVDMINFSLKSIGSEKLSIKSIDSEVARRIFDKKIEISNNSDPESPEIVTQTNIQTKIIPAKQMLPSTHLAEIFPDKYLTKSKSMTDLIVIATLITKQPNLGGLARTCEIFNVCQYVVGSLQQTETISFQSLSMSADKWLKMAEVKLNDLADYLKLLKMQGYSVVGAEQTANSGQITEFRFPKKTALLLGNEKEGIPGNMISMLDYAVEIPQFGLCRSLNVHVCASLFIWEYAKQHQVTKK
ncbi:uncharacterized protein LOC134830279 [Culicoides brevitarsis]|uniref:uncharacterized protein LOC134830279 n=1 Tax=Culicoides brevitarsis TaxID=469753 RepID=UPI00307B9791